MFLARPPSPLNSTTILPPTAQSDSKDTGSRTPPTFVALRDSHGKYPPGVEIRDCLKAANLTEDI
jgi:hypothetical protein